ncbi:MAG: HEAT repeat domain-containing protein [Deltaproteobacteria bacterium]|nr:HEAT repeat domain-containing protein [Deltaproteobacteria bacterium]
MFLAAAELYADDGCIARAAVCRERADDASGALALWQRLATKLESQGDDDADESYAAGLARFNAARMRRRLGEVAAERAELVSAVHDLELAADGFEGAGLRERAFDCYQVLIVIGRESGQLEHALEGYVNAIRVLRDDNLRHYAIKHLKDAIAFAESRGELAAAASLAAELASYGVRLEMDHVVAFARDREAALHERAADAIVARGGTARIAENALLAAVTACADARRFHDVGRLFERLATLDLEAERREHYQRAAARYRTARNEVRDVDEPVDAVADTFELPEVWHVDLVEREDRGTPTATLLDVIHDATGWSPGARLRALAALVEAAPFEQRDASETRSIRLLDRLETLNLYPVLSIVEQLYGSRSPSVREAAVRVLARFTYKRSFVLVGRALHDPEESVRRRARATLASLGFPHAIDPLVRLYRESSESATREAVLAALLRIDLPEAADVLVGALRHGTDEERSAILTAAEPGRNRALSRRLAASLDELPPAERKLVARLVGS